MVLAVIAAIFVVTLLATQALGSTLGIVLGFATAGLIWLAAWALGKHIGDPDDVFRIEREGLDK